MAKVEKERLPVKVFISKVLAGTALGTIIALIPNAILTAILSYVSDNPVAAIIIQAAVTFQLATPLIIGGLIALQFNLKPAEMMVTAGAAFVGSGVIKLVDPSTYVGAGTGDIINIMITASVAVLLIRAIGDKFGSVAIIALPIFVGIGAGVIGMLTLPYVNQVTVGIGATINKFTELQPILMSVLIACSFAALIISPITTVGISLAIQISGVSAGAAAMGIAATTIVLVINSWKVNESGVTLAIALGGMKTMMPNLFRTPIILLPCLFTAVISSIPVTIFGVSGVPSSAGFGLVGLVGPLASLDAGLGIVPLIISWFIVPILAAFLAQFLFEKVFKLYDRENVFKFLG